MAGMSDMWDKILGYASDNDAKSVDMMLRLGCPPTFCNRMGQSALHIGGMWGSVDAVKTLLDARANPNHQNSLRGSTPLHAVALGRGPLDKRIECAKLMVAAGGNPKAADDSGVLPADDCDDDLLRQALGAKPLMLHQAVKERSISALEAELQQNRNDIDAGNSIGETALHLASACGWREGIESLLAARANVRALDSGNQQPLHKAVLRGDHRVVQVLLAAGADPSAQDRNMEHDPRFKSSTFDEQHEKHRTAIHYAAQLGNLLVLRPLLQKSQHPARDVNMYDAQQQTPLHLCLGLRGENAEPEAGSGIRVMGLAKKPEWNGRLGSIVGPARPSADGASERWPVLMEGTDTEAVLLKEDNLEIMPDEILETLLQAKADVNRGSFVSGTERTVLHEAALRNDVHLARQVLETGRAKLDAQDKSGFSALHLAARGRRTEVLRVLVEARADTSLKAGTEGKSVVDLARKNGADASVLALLGVVETADEEMGVQKKAESTTIDSLSEEQKRALFLY
jgi:ankyrin repeat protein